MIPILAIAARMVDAEYLTVQDSEIPPTDDRKRQASATI